LTFLQNFLEFSGESSEAILLLLIHYCLSSKCQPLLIIDLAIKVDVKIIQKFRLKFKKWKQTIYKDSLHRIS